MTEAQLGLWLTALRSGRYTKFQGASCSADESAHCCLGVLSAELHIWSGFFHTLDSPYTVIHDEAEAHCIALNDACEHIDDHYGAVIAALESEPEWYIDQR